MNHNLYLIHYSPKNLPRGSGIFPSSIRQYFANNYPHPLFHNHYPDGRSIYRSRGAPFQFKVINDEVCILAINQGVDFARSFQWPNIMRISLGRNGMAIELELTSKIEKEATFRQADMRCYRSISPYIALNQHKHKTYLSLPAYERRKVIEKGLADHVLTAAKWSGITVNHWIETNLIQVRTRIPIRIKHGLFFVPFDVMFECNTEIPNYIGIGKFVSRGYGTVVQYG